MRKRPDRAAFLRILTYVEIPALSNLDRVAFIDKEIRKGKGQWERRVIEP
ncbi:MAG: hypothetical protein JRI22_18045 [Deltaproteobacteria bacterium]|nr:hypothetical protein [Deltaproteobacteria bacterium]